LGLAEKTDHGLTAYFSATATDGNQVGLRSHRALSEEGRRWVR